MWRHAFVKERYRIQPWETAGRRIGGNARAGGATLRGARSVERPTRRGLGKAENLAGRRAAQAGTPVLRYAEAWR
jgi:hypothetical protein